MHRKREALAYDLVNSEYWELVRNLHDDRKEALLLQIMDADSWEEYLAYKNELSAISYLINMVEDIAEQWEPNEE